jgi:hypothetical protein
MKPRSLIVLVVIFSSLLLTDFAFARKWTDRSGKHSIEAEFVALKKNLQVRLRRQDGTFVEIPLDKLSVSDQNHARKAAAKKSASPFVDPGGDSPTFPPESTTLKADTNTHLVIAQGVGTSPREALDDAFREAVRQVVGLVVDAKTLVKNDELIEDKVLTYSDGFVKGYKKLSETRRKGLVRIKISALVKRRSLVMKLKSANITVKQIDGKSLFGTVRSQIDAENKAEALFRKALDGFPLSCLTAEVIGEPELVKRDASSATIRILTSFRADLEAFDAFGKRLQNVLDGIALEKGEFSLLAMPQTKTTSRTPNLPDTASAKMEVLSESSRGAGYWKDKLPNLYRKNFPKNAFAVAVNDSRNRSMDRTEWKYYVLDNTCRKHLAAVSACVMEVKLTFLDGQGEVITVDRFPLISKVKNVWIKGPYFSLTNSAEGTYGFNGNGAGRFGLRTFTGPGFQPAIFEHLNRLPDDRLYLVCPFFLPSCNYAGGAQAYLPSLCIPRSLSVTLDELRRMKNVKCELRFNGDLPPNTAIKRR